MQGVRLGSLVEAVEVLEDLVDQEQAEQDLVDLVVQAVQEAQEELEVMVELLEQEDLVEVLEREDLVEALEQEDLAVVLEQEDLAAVLVLAEQVAAENIQEPEVFYSLFQEIREKFLENLSYFSHVLLYFLFIPLSSLVFNFPFTTITDGIQIIEIQSNLKKEYSVIYVRKIFNI